MPFSLTKISPVSVLTYLSPSFPVSDVGFVFPFKISFPSSPFGPLILPAGFHVPFSLTKTSPVLVLTKVSPSFPWFSPGFSVPFKISFPSRPSRPAAPVAPATPSVPFVPFSPLSPFSPLILPADFHVPFSLTNTSPVAVLTKVSPSFPISDVGSVFPFKISFPSSPFGPLILPAGFHVPFSLTKTSPVLVLTKVSPSFPWFSPGFSVPFKISFPSRPS